jgi:hypothetical protein
MKFFFWDLKTYISCQVRIAFLNVKLRIKSKCAKIQRSAWRLQRSFASFGSSTKGTSGSGKSIPWAYEVEDANMLEVTGFIESLEQYQLVQASSTHLVFCRVKSCTRLYHNHKKHVYTRTQWSAETITINGGAPMWDWLSHATYYNC